MTEDQYISYFENLAEQSKDINHKLDGKNSFFYIEDGSDLDEFDQALRDGIPSPCMLLVGDDGELDDNDSENHLQNLDGEFFILSRKTSDKTIRQLRAECLPIAINILARMKRDAKAGNIVENKTVHFHISKIPYLKVGPMNGKWYGYMIAFRFECPFGFAVTDANWRDI